MPNRRLAQDAYLQQNVHHRRWGRPRNQNPHAELPQVQPTAAAAPLYLQHNYQMFFSRPRRLRWSIDLHERFVSAVNKLGGPSNATPKQIWNLMGVKEVTLYQIKSHLQNRDGKTAKWLRRNAAPADGPINEEDERQEYEPDAFEMDGDETLETHNNGNLDHQIESQSSETAENPPPISTDFPEWSGLVDEDYLKPIVPRLNSLGYPSELPFLRTHNSSSSTMTFGNFFEDVESFPRIDDDPMMIDDVYPYFRN